MSLETDRRTTGPARIFNPCVCFSHAAPLPTGMHSFPQSKDTRQSNEASSLHVMKEVMIYAPGGCEGNKKNQQGLQASCWQRGIRIEEWLQQIEFFGPADGGPPVVHPQLGVNVLAVGTQGAQRHDQLTSNFWTAQVGPEQPEHCQLTLA